MYPLLFVIVLSSFLYSKNYLTSPFYPTMTGTPNVNFVVEQLKQKYQEGDQIYICPEITPPFKYYFD